ncbi:UDP-glycosyltransferase UGT5-like [Coccinella septempunctata]|uniref:UDP-glycosyltransferase UGT5-like n=1 Tax=Coccinella septempunctata TaxID=41139 RepID=UPI001D07796D|nr:UDP-glycosyltransferase UGT5-like [Coccinella septempunctata]
MFIKMFWCVLLLFSTISYTAESANILFVTTIPSHSHQVVFQPVWKELSLRGHNVTALALSPLNDKSLTNLTEIDLSYIFKLRKRVPKEYIKYVFQKPTFLMVFIREILGVDFVIKLHENILSQHSVMKLINEDYKFDVVVAEWIYPLAGAFATRFNCPLVGITSLGAPLTLLDTVGNPSHPIYAPDHNLPIGRELSLYDRILSTLYSVFARTLYHWVGAPKIDASMRKFFGEDMPYIEDIARNISVLLLNRNPVFHKIMPVVPAAIELGRVRSFGKVKPLNPELKEFLDNSKNGVVYFSLGSNTFSCDLPDNVREILVKVFEQLPYNVVWKWETEVLPGKPNNVFAQNWISQAALLAHPNVKLFITQGGLQSMEETINHHVPVIGIPFHSDQTMNVDTAVKYGFGLRIELEDLSIEGLKSAIHEIMTNQSYKENTAKIEKLMNDIPMEGLDKAIWWIEYVIRHKGARHLRSPSLDIPWYQYFLLDVIAFIALVLSISMYILIKVIKLTIRSAKKLLTNEKQKKQ